jgi:multidrug resistance efflux pump
MNDFERRIRQLINPISTRVTEWWCHSGIRTAWQRRSEGTQRAATAVKDLRDSDAAKRAATAVKDLRDSDAGKRAATALTDLRQRESVRKAEESAKRAMHDLRSGHGSGGSAS